ncbi:MAG: chemotaxis-specific protein-glutamate methyltransferase CheB [Pseudomonadota bacterium]|nr:chemotaxis-specific protein-glutamate methyltransferase CheB [Pseudomonadota bacterium]
MKGALASSRSGFDAGAAPPHGRRLRLMIVDDSMVARAVLARMIEADGGFEIAAVAGTAEDAISALGHIRVDVILLDLEMPGAGGLKSIPGILAAARGAQVLIVSSLAEAGAEGTVAALALGAADTLPKPGTGRFNGRFSEVLLAKLRALGPAEFAPRYASADQGSATRAMVRGPSMADAPLGLIAIGASTGGIHALASLFEALPARIGVPILVTQHLPAPFMTVFARQLATASGRPAMVGEDGMRLSPDQIVIAPGDAHLNLEQAGDRLIVRLSNQKMPSGCLPSVDPMLATAGAVLGPRALGIMLTGMGRDGAEGATRLIASGGSVIAQDEQSSAVWGMPRAVVEAGLACAVLPPVKIARRIALRAEETLCR